MDGLLMLVEAMVDNNVNLVTFHINENEYQVEEGMTWEEFINSNS